MRIERQQDSYSGAYRDGDHAQADERTDTHGPEV